MKYGEGKYGSAKYGATVSVDGSITPTGSLSCLKMYLRNVGEATLNISGEIGRSVSKIFTGAITSSGYLIKYVPKVFSGALSMSGSAAKTMFVVASGLISLSGLILKSVRKNISGAISSVTGSVLKHTTKAMSGSVTIAGNAVKLNKKVLSGSISITGSISKRISKTAGGILSFLGQVFRWWQVFPVLILEEYPIEIEVTEYPIEIEVIGVPKAGASITLQATFPNSAGNLSQLASVTTKIYGPGRVLLSTITPSELSPGVYTTVYPIPATVFGQCCCEVSGVLGDKTILDREIFSSDWS